MRKPRILIVEDEPAILRLLAKVFSEEGFEVSAAEDGEKGLAAGLFGQPDIVLFDIVMPNMDGITMLTRMRRDGGKWGKGVKAIVYSNLSYNETRDEAREAGVADFLVKVNVRVDEVIRRVREELAASMSGELN
ncbi:MAG TPA: response regulator [Candidatus Paceibacterota bacterium]|jgi:DNA-binding response OmpR family regulator|nr:response regulator [Candidatus Paceibacterota bacterium]